jgi:hypothetical protein
MSHSPFGLGLAHTRLLVVGDMAELHHTGQGPGKAGRDEFPSAYKELHKVTMDPFVGPFAPSHPPPLSGTDGGLKERKVGAVDGTVPQPMRQTEFCSLQ